MTISVVEYSPAYKDQFLEFCEQQSKLADPAAVNMKSLPELLTTDRFDSPLGVFYLLVDDNKLIGCSGVYKSYFNRKIALAGTRTWISPEYRHLSLNGFYLLPAQKQWAIENRCKQIALCFNDYNKNLMKVFVRPRLSESNDRIVNRPPSHLFYSNINELPFPVNIQDTKQWVLYEKIDTDWEFDWSKIKCF
jgi:hypothetical protein